MRKVELRPTTREEFEATVGKTFGTINTNNGVVYSLHPTKLSEDSVGYYSMVEFTSYEQYLEYIK